MDLDDSIVGFTASAWDLLHPGHLVFLGQCMQRCDRLIIGLHVDPSKYNANKQKPIETVMERYMRLEMIIRPTDTIFPYESENDLLNVLGSTDIHRRFIGSDYIGKEDTITGWDLVPQLIYIERNHSWSSTEYRNRLKNGSKT